MRYNRTYHWLLGVNPRYRYAYTASWCFVAVLIWFFFLYVPMHKALLRIDQEKARFKKEGDLYVEQQAACAKLMSEINNVQNDLKNICDKAASASICIDRLMQSARQFGLQLIALRSSERKEHEGYITEKSTLEASGSLSAIISFFDSLSACDSLIQCDDFSLRKQHDDIFILRCVLRQTRPKCIESTEIKSPSTLKKAEGLGG